MNSFIRNTAIAGAALLLLTGCTQSTDPIARSIAPDQVNTEDGLHIVAAMPALYSLTSQVAGDNAEVTNLLPPGASPHTYSPSPSDLILLNEADVVVTTGYGVEEYAQDMLEDSGNENLYELNFVGEVETREGGHDHHAHGHDKHGDEHEEDEHDDHEDEHAHDEEEEHDDHEDEQDGTIDPHIWLSVENMIAMTQHVADELSTIDPDNADSYAANADAYIAELEELDTYATEQLANISHPNFIPFHPAWGYFAEHYGMNEVDAIELVPGQEPSAKQIATLIEKIEDNDVAALFAEPQLEARIIDQIAEETGLDIFTVDPVGTPNDNGDFTADTYIDTMTTNVDTFAEALQ